jgi:hypothetical protein
MASGTMIVVAAVIVIVIIVAAFLLMGSGSVKVPGASNTTSTGTTNTSSSSGQSGQVPIAMTDPAQVPAGTQALVVTYSSVQADETGPSGSGWVSAAGSGSINLTSASSGSGQVIGHVSAATGAAISAVRLAVTSAYITVNGTTYNVTVPQQTLSAQVNGSTSVSSGSAVIVDVSPTLAAVYSQNTTAFVMAPTTKAVVASNTGASAQAGSRFSLNSNVQASLTAATPNIKITSASISASGNSTVLSITVNDNSNGGVVLNNVVVNGAVNATASSSAGANASVTGSINGILGGTTGTAGINASIIAALRVGFNLKAFQQTTFVASGSSLVQVTGAGSVSGSSGATVGSASSTTLSFNGETTYDSGVYHTTIVPGSSYTIVVTGQNGATASTVVTAT